MAKSKKNIVKRKPSLYNKVLKQFTKINNQLPEDRRLSIQERRRIVREVLLPQFKGESVTQVKVGSIKKSIFQVVNTVAPKEECDINYISPSVIANIPWFDLDEYITKVLPNCIYIRIDAGKFGKTKIFNTRDYNYTKDGVKKIVDNIREELSNNSKMDISLSGIKRVKRGKPNDGTPENYFIDFILVIDSDPVTQVTPTVFNLPKTTKPKVKSVREAILERVKQLNQRKTNRKNARKTASKNIKKLAKINKRQKAAKRPQTKERLADEKLSYYKSMQRQLDNALKKGNLTQEQYDKFSLELTLKILDNRKKGGQI